MPILDALKKFTNAWKERAERKRAARVEAFLDELFHYFPFTPMAQEWFRKNVRVEVLDFDSVAGGGRWYPEERVVRLDTAQYEAAIHELAHAWWQGQPRDRPARDALIDMVKQLERDLNPRWERLHRLAVHYLRGIPTQPGFERGMLLPPEEWGKGGGWDGEWNDTEIYAGLASGCMGDLRKMPPYLRLFYTTLFVQLPPDAPSPEDVAPHR